MSSTKTTYVLHMTSPDQFSPKDATVPGLRIDRMEDPSPEFNKYLHLLVGHPHKWGGRTDWSRDQWASFVENPGVETWVGFFGATPVGYFELSRDRDEGVQIVCFGLLPEYVGRGIGGPFLNRAIERAWEMGASRVWLTTCSHDHPHALDNYKARGFQVAETREGPANQPWPSFWEQVAER